MRRDRAVFAAAAVLVWAMAGPARGIASALRDAGLLTSLVWLALAVAIAGMAGVARRTGGDPEDDRPSLLVLAATALAWGFLASRWTLPEERLHLVIFPVLGWLAWRATGPAGSRSVGWACAAVVLVGALDELNQGLRPDRQFDWMDVLANAVGGVIVPLLMLRSRGAWIAPGLLALTAAAFGPLQAAIGVGGASPPMAEASIPVHAPRASTVAASQAPSGGEYTAAHLVLITIDALRADHVPPVGHAPVATPTLDALAADSIACTNAWAAGSWTSPSMVSMLSGLHPSVHGVNSRGVNMGAGPVLPLETLAAAGWTVLGHAGDATENYRNLGIRRELDRSDEAEAIGAALRDADGPVFGWVHLRDVHAPYDATPERLAELGLDVELPTSPILDRARTHLTVPRDGFPGRHRWLQPAIRALYAAEVADADASLRRVLDAIDASGQADRTIVVLSADHGEELLETDAIGHASTTLNSVPLDVLQRIPLLVRLPDRAGAGTVYEGVVRQQDILPTLLPLLGVQHPSLSDDPLLHGVAIDLRGDTPSARAADSLPLWFYTSPCGWQCPPERRGERVSASLIQGAWTWCRLDTESAGCAAHAPWLARGRALGVALGSPVAE